MYSVLTLAIYMRTPVPCKVYNQQLNFIQCVSGTDKLKVPKQSVATIFTEVV